MMIEFDNILYKITQPLEPATGYVWCYLDAVRGKYIARSVRYWAIAEAVAVCSSGPGWRALKDVADASVLDRSANHLIGLDIDVEGNWFACEGASDFVGYCLATEFEKFVQQFTTPAVPQVTVSRADLEALLLAVNAHLEGNGHMNSIETAYNKVCAVLSGDQQ